jgi:transmembrane sensor
MEMAMEENEFYTQLVRRYADNLLSEEELEVFFHALRAGWLSPYLVTAMTEAGAIPAVDAETEILARETAEVPIPAGQPNTPVRRLPRWTRVAAAAALFIVLAGGAWLWLGRPVGHAGVAGEIAQQPIPPAGNKATLTLANGQTIVLDSAARGSLAMQGNARVLKTDSGKLAYQPMSNSTGSAIVYNTLTTPRGGQYQLVLPDGSRVWLNAASSITYPTAFTGADRSVTVSGEAYFDVVKNTAKPFKVIVRTSHAGQAAEVEVLGTGFNIMAYADEPEPSIRATLIRGAIRVSQGKTTALLHPGQQAQIITGNEPNPIHLIDNADTAAAIAWITGFFQFRELDVPAVMRQIGRWYNVDVVYDTPAAGLAGRHFGGRISRRQNLSDLLPMLEANHIHFRIDGTTIHVLP